ncbi:hypothetical protein OM416_20545 [Paenibacillus sp. LS1]|uniref:hypothetical protein n=1 Tax=Paenibacillus sp. LS1 TaxID=2992120 RepID=UPI0022329D07|nr:hypothetical protein [Paenibacillus sp. LS1]MCW3793988.1 hypothetical protein [Paenibacillus sp. LS1]
MLNFEYSVAIDASQIEGIQLTCKISYSDPVFEQRIINILKIQSLYFYVDDEEGTWLTKKLGDEINMKIFLSDRLFNFRKINDEFRQKEIFIPVKYFENLERVKYLFEKKIRKVFKKEIKYFNELSAVNI